MKDGKAVPVAATVEVHFRMLRTSEANIWYSGPTAFRLSAGITLPVAEDGSMPRPGKEVADESAVLEFTVNTNGSVRNVHSIYGSASASELLGRYLSGWKFRPAVDRGGFIEATGRIQFIKGKGDEAVNRPLFDFPTPAPTISVSDTGSPAPQIDQIDTAGPRGSEHPASLVNPKDGLRYVWIPPGVFTMGCSQGDTECVDNEKPPHEEQIVSGFWLGQTEVTQAAYQRVTGSNPSAHKGDQLPVESVTWNDAASYCGAIGGHLPSEVEWEYAARGGVPWARYGDLDAVAWHSGNSGGTAHPVGLKQRNAFGLFDMLGNVWEWVLDSYPDSSGSDKILRGGSWRLAPTNARVSRRFVVKPSDSADGRGFRCVVSSAPPNEDNLPGGLGEQVYHVGNGVSAPELIHHISVEYSEAARNQKISGVVILDIIIDARGTVVDPKVITGLGFGLDDKAIEAVRQWKFRPGYKDGKPVAVAMRVQVAFRLE
jgi:TonB family protein